MDDSTSFDQDLTQNTQNDVELKNGGDTFALKVINKKVLHPGEVDVIRGESKILKTLVDQPNVVQFSNIFETDKFIII